MKIKHYTNNHKVTIHSASLRHIRQWGDEVPLKTK